MRPAPSPAPIMPGAMNKRVVPESMNWKLLVDTFHEGYHIGFLHRKSLSPILHGNVADFELFGPNHRLTFPRRKLERLKAAVHECAASA